VSEVSSKEYLFYKQRVRENLSPQEIYTDAQVEEVIFQTLAEEQKKTYIDARSRVDIGRRIFYALRGLDVLQPLMEDPDITDIMVNGPECIYYEKQGHIFRHSQVFESTERLEDVVQQIVGAVNRIINEANPIVDARLPDGSRVNAVFAPVALNGPFLTIRRFRENPITLAELIEWGTVTEEAATFLKEAVCHRYNIFVCGGTASGKTTLLNVLSNFIPPQERIVTIEDTAELRLGGSENIVSMETRNKNVEGKGAISIRDLIRTSLRMRPDRIIVGEVRGEEALDMLQAMNSGHDGSLSTGHANSCRDMLSRIETMVLMGADFPLEAVRAQIASAIDLMVFVRRGEAGRRYVEEIVQVVGQEQGRVMLDTLFERKEGCLVRTESVLCRRKEKT
jgi:pilus assembly protein CpaF